MKYNFKELYKVACFFLIPSYILPSTVKYQATYLTHGFTLGHKTEPWKRLNLISNGSNFLHNKKIITHDCKKL